MSSMKAATTTERESRISSEIPPPTGVAIILLYLLLFHYWAQFVYGDFSFVVLRICFLTAVLVFLMGRLGLSLSDTIGRLDIPDRAQLKFVALALIVAITLRLALKCWAQSLSHGADMRAFTAWNFVYECIVPPLNEEPVYRGLALTSLLSIFKPRRWQAIVLAALIFCSAHDAHNLNQQVAALILGFLEGVIFVRTRSLISCIILHAIWNFVIFVPVTL